MKSRSRRKVQNYRKRLKYLRKQHSRARVKLLLVLLSVLSPLYAPKVRICLAEPVHCHRPTVK